MFIRLAVSSLCFVSFSTFASPWITLPTSSLDEINVAIPMSDRFDNGNGVSLVRVSENDVDQLAGVMHANRRLGGFMAHETSDEALFYMNGGDAWMGEKGLFVDYSISESAAISPLLPQVSESNIINTISTLSAYNNRHAKTTNGKDAALWIKSKWESLVQHRNDARVELFANSFVQPSVILTIRGATNPNDIILIGGHEDSLAGYSSTSRAPGADDNASGIATMTEIIRVLMDNNYQPQKTLRFAAFAGEELGLLGSKAYAADMKKQNASILGYMNLDMTNYKGSDRDVWFVSDNSNAAQNQYIGQLLDTYVKATWGYTACGYGCSDHASFTANGFPASFPFEAKDDEYNKDIHSSRDLLAVTNGRAEQSLVFAKLGIAFAIEMAK